MAPIFGKRLSLVLAGVALALAAPLLLPVPAAAQFSNTYNFLKGVRDRDFAAVEELVDAPGSTVINVRDRSTGEGALHIVVKRRDTQWLLFLLRARANPDIRDADGNTPMHLSAQIGFSDGIRWLTVVEADVNATNNRGETPLVLAVQQHNAEVVRQLVDAGANPDIPDAVVGMSARDYAERDPRGRVLVQLLDMAQTAAPETETVGPTFD